MSIIIWEGVMHYIASYLAEPSLRGLTMQNLARTHTTQNKPICTHTSYVRSPTDIRITVSISIPHSANTIRRQHLQLALNDEVFRADDQVGPTSDSHPGVARAQGLERHMDRNGARRARGVDGDRWAVPVEEVRDSIGEDRPANASRQVRRCRLKVAKQ